MGLLSLFLCICIAVLPFIQGHTPEHVASIRQAMGTLGAGVDPPMRGVYPVDRAGQGRGYGSSYEYGRTWCTCRQRCRYSETTVRYTCALPFYPRYWNTCCKYLSNYQTSSMYRGYGRSNDPTYPQINPAIPDYEMSRLPPKGA